MINAQRKEKIDYLLRDLLAVPEKGAHQISIKLIRLMNEIVMHIYEQEKSQDTPSNTLFHMPSVNFSHAFPALGFIEIPKKKQEAPKSYISLKEFTKTHGELISSSQAHLYFHYEFKESCFKNSKGWFLDESKFLGFLLTKRLYKDRIYANREKYGSLLSL